MGRTRVGGRGLGDVRELLQVEVFLGFASRANHEAALHDGRRRRRLSGGGGAPVEATRVSSLPAPFHGCGHRSLPIQHAAIFPTLSPLVDSQVSITLTICCLLHKCCQVAYLSPHDETQEEAHRVALSPQRLNELYPRLQVCGGTSDRSRRDSPGEPQVGCGKGSRVSNTVHARDRR